MQFLYQQFFAFFASLKLTIVVLLLLLFGLLSGMFWDQTLSLEDHLRTMENSPLFAKFFVFIEGYDVFHSWWFGIVVLFLALNLIACSIERLPKIWIDIHNPERILTDQLFKKLPHKFKINTSILKANEFVKKFFKSEFFSQIQEDTTFIYQEKHKYARTGVYVVHIALLMIMFGSMGATNLGIDGMMAIAEGQEENIVQLKGPGGLFYRHKLDFNVRCNDFRLKTYVDGSPMAFESDLSILDKKQKTTEIVKKTIRVNEPLQYEGYTFYQASYQPLPGDIKIKLSIGPHGKKHQIYTLPLGGKTQMPDGVTFIPMEVIEDYGGLGEAVKVKQIDTNEKSTSFVVFRQYPDFDIMVRRGKWDVFFQGFDQAYATGVSVGKVPFIELVFGGFLVMFIGLYMAFFMSERRYFVRIKKLDNENCELCIAGIARRHTYAFADEFKNLVDWIKE